jgi:hypothetical protein
MVLVNCVSNPTSSFIPKYVNGNIDASVEKKQMHVFFESNGTAIAFIIKIIAINLYNLGLYSFIIDNYEILIEFLLLFR